MRTSKHFACFAFLALLGATLPAQGQCSFDWRPGEPLAGVDGPVWTMTKWDSDGSGPNPEMLFVGGYFRVAGDENVSNLAAWDGIQWHAPAGGVFNGTVLALAVYENELVVGGVFDSV